MNKTKNRISLAYGDEVKCDCGNCLNNTDDEMCYIMMTENPVGTSGYCEDFVPGGFCHVLNPGKREPVIWSERETCWKDCVFIKGKWYHV